jgi:hypothetical protein
VQLIIVAVVFAHVSMTATQPIASIFTVQSASNALQ